MKLTRSTALLALVVSTALVFTACGGNDDESAQSDKSTSTTSEKAAGQTTTTLDNETFTTAISAVNSAITAAGSDPCDVSNAANSSPPMPGNAVQTEQFIRTYVTLLKSVASALPAASVDSKAALEDAATQLLQTAEKKKFSTDVLGSEEFNSTMGGDAVNAALAEFNTLTQNCASPRTDGGSTGPSTTAG